MTRQLAAEFAPKVRVNAIGVGGVETSALEQFLADDSMRRALTERTPMQRIGEPEDIAACALFLASPASSWVTGNIYEVDGGAEHPAVTVPVPPLG
jgi:7-alpha-hydroxysteroid dehydrogenase